MIKNEFEDDIVFAKFVNYMRKALLNKRLDYYKKIHKIEEYEVRIDETMDYIDEKNDTEITIDKNILNDKERYLLSLYYEHGLSYKEISKITGEDIAVLKQRKYRACLKLKKKRED